MRRRLTSLVALSGLLAVGGSLNAQEDQAAGIEQIDPDLRCAIWSAGVLEMVGETEVKTGVTAAFTYFAGRYEGSSGKSLDEAMTPELVRTAMAQFPALSQDCQPRMVELGDRLNTLGDALKAARPQEGGSSGE